MWLALCDHSIVRMQGRWRLNKFFRCVEVQPNVLQFARGPLKMDHVFLFPHSVSQLTFTIGTHCKRSVGATRILVTQRRGWEKDRCCYVQDRLLPVDSNKVNTKYTRDGQKPPDKWLSCMIRAAGQRIRIWISNIIFKLHHVLFTLTN